MKQVLIMITLLGSGVVFSQKITVNSDKCNHCSMVIRDEAFAAIAVDPTSGTLKFDAIECLVNFLKESPESNYLDLLVSDYSKKGWVDARSATYLKSPEIPSPMGAYLTAYADKSTATKIQKERGGELFDWAGLKLRFKESRFGVLNHIDHHHSADAFAPAGIMGDHMHHKGGFMLSYRAMFMTMRENLEGGREADHMAMHMNYMMVPDEMVMSMHMLGVMYAPSDRVTVMVMQSIIKKEMSMMHMAGKDAGSRTAGLSDLNISALVSLVKKQQTSLHFNSRVSVPIGSVTQSTSTTMSDNVRLPYPMQIGSGSLDLMAGATFRQAMDKFSFGIQELSTFRTAKNSEGYRLGNEYKLNTWGSYSISPFIATSVRVEGVKLSEIRGEDALLDKRMSPEADAMNSGYFRLRAFLGTNVTFGNHPYLKNLRVGFEYGLPVYQYVNGIQMKESSTWTTGLFYTI